MNTSWKVGDERRIFLEKSSGISESILPHTKIIYRNNEMGNEFLKPTADDG